MSKILKKILKGVLRDEELELVAGGYDLIGDIAVLRISDELPGDKKRMVGSLLLKHIPSIKSVWNQVKPVSGEFRLRGLEHLAGEKRSSTVHREHGCLFKVDILKAYFSPRLSTERQRVASLVKEGEVVHNMFAGVCPFSITIAKKRDRVYVYSSEINPSAYDLMVENIVLNHVEKKVIPLLGDALQHSEALSGVVGRVLMPLPEKALEALPVVTNEVKAGGFVHVYLHLECGKKECVGKAIRLVKNRVPGLKPVHARVVREVAPKTYQVVVDAVKL